VASLSQGRTAAAQCGLFTHKSVPVIFEPPCTLRKWNYTRTPDKTRETIILIKIKSCNVLLRMLLVRIRSYIYTCARALLKVNS